MLSDFLAHDSDRLLGSIARRVNSHSVAADICHEAYARFLRLSNPEQVTDLRRFLFKVAINLLRDHYRSQKRQERFTSLPEDLDVPDPEPSVEEQLTAERQQQALQAAIDTLPSKTRTVFLLYRAEGLSYRDIAQQLAISTRTVEYHLRQALSHCRRALQDYRN
jgi:RNA polymerase sigma-70 factor (ECF subfamily)